MPTPPRLLALLGLLLVAVSIPSTTPAAGTSAAEKSTREMQVDELFNTLIPHLQVQFTPAALSALRARPREYTQVTIREGPTVQTNVAAKLKGGIGSWREIDGRPGFTLKFDKFQTGQRFHGLAKVHLNNAVQDYTLLNEILAGAVFRAAGLPAARATHACLKLNEDDAFAYVLKESFDRDFLKRHFQRADGNLYDGGFVQDIDAALEQDSGSGPADRSDLKRLHAAAMEPDLTRRHELLARELDIDRFLSFMALERLLGHWDGYCGNRNNYRLYHDPTSQRFVFIPHGMDQLFGDANFALLPGAQNVPDTRFGRGGFRGRGRRGGVVASKVLEVPELRQKYIARLGELLDQVFTVEKFEAELKRIEDRLQKQLTPADTAVSTHLQRQITQVRSRITARIAAARQQHAALVQQMAAESK